MASITVVGSGFTGTTMCFFGSTGVTISLNAAGTSFTCIPPIGSGTVSIGITSFGGTIKGTGEKGYTYVGTPTITSLGATMGPMAGGTMVVITGSNYYDRSVDTFPGIGNTLPVFFGNITSTGGSIVTTTTVIAHSPASATAGSVGITLTTPTGTAKSTDITFTYIAVPTVSSTFPSGPSGPLSGGTRVSIVGTNLLTTTGITMGGTRGATLQFITDVGITFLSPPSTTVGLRNIQVTTVGGSVTATDAFTYVGFPVVDSITPAVGPNSGGTVIIANGTFLSNPRSVLFLGSSDDDDTYPATAIVSHSTGTTLQFTSPENFVGLAPVGIIIQTAGGTANFQSFVFLDAPTITSVTPNRGPTGGG